MILYYFFKKKTMQTTVNTMRQASHYLLLCILICVGLSSCHDDIEEQGEATTTQLTTVDVQELTQGDIAGYIYDESGVPINDVQVSVLGSTTRTNEYGVFVFRDVDLDRNGTYITATKVDYILGSDRIYPDEADVNHSYIKMLKLTSNTVVNAANGGSIVVQGGGIITFPTNAIANSDGTLYEGQVTVTAKRIAADDSDLADVMPGGLVAMDKDGYTRVLGTLGMVAVELRDVDGKELNLADGVQASIQFPIADTQLDSAPDQIALWSFDETRGLWIEEGFATRDGNKYIGEVSHFSFWNCDAPFPLVSICGNVFNTDGTPGSNLLVQVVADVVYPVGYGYTDDRGRFCGKVPKGEELTITVFFPGCPDGYTFTVGPFDSDTELDPITLDNGENGVISGTVFCDDNPVANASVIVNIDGQNIIYLTDENGGYSFNTSIFGCNQPDGGSIFAIDNDSNEASASLDFDVYENASIDFNTCGGCEMILNTSTGFADVCNIETYFAKVDVIDPNGMVTYSWNVGANTQTIPIMEAGIYCVTVTDQEDCEEISCIEFDYTPLADSLVVINSNCVQNNGSINSNPFGGTEPYNFQIFNAFGQVMSTSSEATDLAPGSYSVLVTDSNGCTVGSTVAIADSGFIPEFLFNQGCGVTQLLLNSQTSNVTISLDGVETLNNVWVYVSGDYCFDLTDVNTGCMETRCLFVEVFEEIPPVVNVSCNFPFYSIDWSEEVTEASYQGQNSQPLFDLASPSSFDISPLAYGYQGTLNLLQDYNVNLVCEYEQIIDLPSFEGLDVVANEVSCADCEDGFFEIIIDDNADCNQCILGSVAIYDADNDAALQTDLTELNNEQILSSGRYHVIVTDADSGCIIAHRTLVL